MTEWTNFVKKGGYMKRVVKVLNKHLLTTKRRDTRKRRRVTNKSFFVSLLYSMSTYTLSNQSPASRLIYLDSRDGFPLQINSVTGESLSTYFKYTLDKSISIPAEEDVLVSLHFRGDFIEIIRDFVGIIRF